MYHYWFPDYNKHTILIKYVKKREMGCGVNYLYYLHDFLGEEKKTRMASHRTPCSSLGVGPSPTLLTSLSLWYWWSQSLSGLRSNGRSIVTQHQHWHSSAHSPVCWREKCWRARLLTLVGTFQTPWPERKVKHKLCTCRTPRPVTPPSFPLLTPCSSQWKPRHF